MKVAIRKSLDIPSEVRNDLIAFAGASGAYRQGMAFRQVVGALAETVGTGFLDQCRTWLASQGPGAIPIQRRTRQVSEPDKSEPRQTPKKDERSTKVG